ncbi:MAG: DnaJ domain-containing protein [Nitrososphaera sp.]
MTDSKGYYLVLGVSEKATYKEIRHAYRQLARKYHPDRNSSPFAEEMIKKINAAFEVLSDQTKRSQYDRMELDNPPEPEPSSYEPEPVQTGSNSEDQWKVARDGVDGSNNPVADFFNGPYHLDTPKSRFHIIVEPTLCMAFGSCETLAPKVFVVEKHKRLNPKAVVECETCADYEKIHAAAATCPTKAIKIIDRYTGEQLYP